jgi:hypothetical protein
MGLLLLVACSTILFIEKFTCLSTKYNILYNGQIGLDKGIKTIESGNQDDFGKTPIKYANKWGGIWKGKN